MEDKTQEIQGLRDWSARKMGWKEINCDDTQRQIYSTTLYNSGFIMWLKDWQPDNPSTGQIWMLVERMRELGYGFALYSWMGMNKTVAKFWISEEWRAEDPNPCLAILKAARVAED